MIAVYVKPETLTVEQYDKARKGLAASGANLEGRKHHSCFGEDGQLMVFEIWGLPGELRRLRQVPDARSPRGRIVPPRKTSCRWRTSNNRSGAVWHTRRVQETRS